MHPYSMSPCLEAISHFDETVAPTGGWRVCERSGVYWGVLSDSSSYFCSSQLQLDGRTVHSTNAGITSPAPQPSVRVCLLPSCPYYPFSLVFPSQYLSPVYCKPSSLFSRSNPVSKDPRFSSSAKFPGNPHLSTHLATVHPPWHRGPLGARSLACTLLRGFLLLQSSGEENERSCIWKECRRALETFRPVLELLPITWRT